MTTLATLERKLQRLEKTSFPPRHHIFLLEDGDQLTADQRAKIRPGDQVVIRLCPKGYLDRV